MRNTAKTCENPPCMGFCVQTRSKLDKKRLKTDKKLANYRWSLETADSQPGSQNNCGANIKSTVAVLSCLLIGLIIWDLSPHWPNL